MTHKLPLITYLVEETEKWVTRLFSRWCLWCSSVAVWTKRGRRRRFRCFPVIQAYRTGVTLLLRYSSNPCRVSDEQRVQAKQTDWFEGFFVSRSRRFDYLDRNKCLVETIRSKTKDKPLPGSETWRWEEGSPVEEKLNWSDHRLLKAGMFLLNAKIFIFGEYCLSLSNQNL